MRIYMLLDRTRFRARVEAATSYERSQQQNDPHCFQSLSLDEVLEAQWGDCIHGVLLILINVATFYITSSMQKKMTVWLITFQVGGVLNLFFFLQVAIRVGELAYTL